MLATFAMPLFLLVSPVALAGQPKPHKLSTTTNYIVALSQGWWGVRIEDFPTVVGLQPGEYQMTDNPVDKSTKIIIIRSKRFENTWRPREIPPFSFEFSPTDGLIEISGFYKGTQDQVYEVLKEKYGLPTRRVKALNMQAYGWDFLWTYLDLTAVYFQLSIQDPERRRKLIESGTGKNP